MRFIVFLALQNEIAIFPRVEVSQLWKALLHLLEEVQHRIAVIGELHLGVQVYVDVKVVGIRDITIHPTNPKYVDMSSVSTLRPALNRRRPQGEYDRLD